MIVCIVDFILPALDFFCLHSPIPPCFVSRQQGSCAVYYYFFNRYDEHDDKEEEEEEEEEGEKLTSFPLIII